MRCVLFSKMSSQMYEDEEFRKYFIDYFSKSVYVDKGYIIRNKSLVKVGYDADDYVMGLITISISYNVYKIPRFINRNK